MFEHEPIHPDWLNELSENEYNVLHEIRAALQAKQTQRAPVRISDLMPALGIAYNTIARAIKSLESRGLLRASSGTSGTVRTFQIDPSAARPTSPQDSAPLLNAGKGTHPTPPTPEGGVSVGEVTSQEVAATAALTISLNEIAAAARHETRVRQDNLRERDLVKSLGLDVDAYFALPWIERWYALRAARETPEELLTADDPVYKLWKDQTPEEKRFIADRARRKAHRIMARRRLDEELAEWKRIKDPAAQAPRTSQQMLSITDSEQLSRMLKRTSTSLTMSSTTDPTDQQTPQQSSFIGSQMQPLPA